MKQRVISAVVLVAVTLFCIFISPVVRVLFFAAAGMVCAYELSKNFEKLDARCTLWVMIVYLSVQALLVLMKVNLFTYAAWFVFCLYLALFSGIVHLNVGGKGALYTLAGLTYPCVLFSIIMVISVSDIWRETLALGALSAWLCDTFALFGGMAFGKHKLAPQVSPNKTIEGFISGMLSSIPTGIIISLLSAGYTPIPMWICIASAVICSTMGQIGDLAESLMKRMIGVKDFSNLIPGHGGMFDRVDSLLFSIPSAYFCLYFALHYIK